MSWDELLGVVDEKDNLIGKATKREVYDKKLRHRIVHVFLLHPRTKQLYLQRRSPQMSYMPNCWCSSAAGHVMADEDVAAAAQRELEEELGIKVPLKLAATVPFVLDEHERFLSVFVGNSQGPFHLNAREVSEGKFFSAEEIIALIQENIDIHPQLPPCFEALEKNLRK